MAQRFTCLAGFYENLARADFTKLDEMFDILRYPIGIFINIAVTDRRIIRIFNRSAAKVSAEGRIAK
jgi:hypothetical protein